MNHVEKLMEQVRLQSRLMGNLTLGELRRELAAAPASNAVLIDRYGAAPAAMASYRGYYDHVAIETSCLRTTVGAYLAVVDTALKATFEGYKGGSYEMGTDTPVWVSEWGQCSGVAVVGVKTEGAITALQTNVID